MIGKLCLCFIFWFFYFILFFQVVLRLPEVGSSPPAHCMPFVLKHKVGAGCQLPRLVAPMQMMAFSISVQHLQTVAHVGSVLSLQFQSISSGPSCVWGIMAWVNCTAVWPSWGSLCCLRLLCGVSCAEGCPEKWQVLLGWYGVLLLKVLNFLQNWPVRRSGSSFLAHLSGSDSFCN